MVDNSLLRTNPVDSLRNSPVHVVAVCAVRCSEAMR